MRRLAVWCLALLGGAMVNLSTFGTAADFPPFDQLPVRVELPDPLTMLDGSPVTTPEQWVQKRRPELRALFQHYMYGRIPAKPQRWEKDGPSFEDPKFLDGKATLREDTLAFYGPDLTQRLRVLVVRPNKPGPAPTFVAMNFCGNHAVVADPRVQIPTTWIYPSCAGVENDRATEKGRGSQADVWNVDLIVSRGYALATFYSGDIDPDTPDFSDGIEPAFYQPGQTSPRPDDAGDRRVGLGLPARRRLRTRHAADRRRSATRHRRRPFAQRQDVAPGDGDGRTHCARYSAPGRLRRDRAEPGPGRRVGEADQRPVPALVLR